MEPIRAYAPASIGNFAAGFDVLGAALAPLDGTFFGDVVQIEEAAHPSLQILGPHARALRADPRLNPVIGACDLFRDTLGLRGLPCGPFAFTLEKRLPPHSGLGSNSSAIAAALTALQAACGNPLSLEDLLELAARAEGLYDGHHFENVAPALLGGLRITLPGSQTRELPWPGELLLVVAHPEFELPPARSRAALPASLPLATCVEFGQNLGAFIVALHTGDRNLLALSLRDPLAEPFRAELVPGFRRIQAVALGLGALGCTLSGQGPSVFAVVDGPERAARVADALRHTFREEGLGAQAWVCGLDLAGARVIS